MGGDGQRRWKVEVGLLILALDSLAGLLLLSTLVLLHHLPHLSLGRSLPPTTAGPGRSCLNYSQNLLRAVSDTLQKVSFSLSLSPPCSHCSLSSEETALNPWSPEGTAGKLWKLIRSCQERKRELYKWPNY